MAHSIAIVGGGPKGLYALERLLAWLKQSPPQQPVSIHLYNKSDVFGAGDIYDPRQPDYLRLNFSVDFIDMWPPDGPSPSVPRPESLMEWCAEHCPEWAVGGEFPPRAIAGAYLVDGLRQLLRHLPDGVTVHRHHTEVTDVWPLRQQFGLQTSDGRSSRAEAILLATGHPTNTLPATVRDMRRDALARGLQYVTNIYPVEQQLTRIPAGSRVGIRGMTLTFIDAALALTEGRGGFFEEALDGSLCYHPSGREPAQLLPWSRSGQLAPPKAIDNHQASRTLHFVTPERLAELSRRSAPVDFERELWPLVVADMEWAWLDCAFRRATGAEPLVANGDLGALRRAVTRVAEQQPRFCIESLLNPTPPAGASRHDAMLEQLRAEIERAQIGIAGSPTKAALDVWRWARERLLPLMNFGGLTPRSHAALKKTHWPTLKRLAFGPPLINARKILALAEAGIICFDADPESNLSLAGPGFQIQAAAGCPPRTVDHFIDARMAKPDLKQDASALYRNLLKRGLARPFVNHAGAERYQPGALDITSETCSVRDHTGRPTDALCAIGIPTEGVVFGNESLSRRKNPFAAVWAEQVVRQLHASERQARQRRVEPAVCVVGAGHGGLGLAAWLALQGRRVHLLNRSNAALQPIRRQRAIQVDGELCGPAPIARATTDARAALDGAAIVIVAVPAFAHEDVARWLAPHLVPDQIVLLSPGRTLGSLYFTHTLAAAGSVRATVAEAQTLLVASRSQRPGQVRILGVKHELPVALLGAADVAHARRLKQFLPQLRQAESALETSINNIGAILHPALALLNCARIDTGTAFKFYAEGASSSISQVLEQADRERFRIAAALDTPFLSVRDWLRRNYGAVGRTLHEALGANPAYRTIAGPSTLDNRYITEDVPFGLVPMSSLARRLRIETPTIDALIALASAVHGRDFRREGRTLSGLGLSAAELIAACRSREPWAGVCGTSTPQLAAVHTGGDQP